MSDAPGLEGYEMSPVELPHLDAGPSEVRCVKCGDFMLPWFECSHGGMSVWVCHVCIRGVIVRWTPPGVDKP